MNKPITQREFNTTGPCIHGRHYMLDPMRGLGDELMNLITRGHYFVIHAARQSGKTTLLLDLVDKINAAGNYFALYCSLEVLDGIKEPEKGIPAIIHAIKNALDDYDMPPGFAINVDLNDFANVLKKTLSLYCKTLNKPLVIFFDEADCLSNGTLIAFLRQLRSGFISRNRTSFVHSAALVGMRNLRDYSSRIRPDSESLGGASPFNIVKENFTLRNFTKVEVAELYQQHTAETKQAFESAAINYAFEQTQGQPWLINAIAAECVDKITKNNHSIPITRTHAEQAVMNICLDRRTHIDSMMDKLKDPRVRKIILPLITGEELPDKGSDDYLYTRDLGLIRETDNNVEPANPIYAEMIVRTLNWNTQDSIKNNQKDYIIPRYLKDDKIDMNFLLKDFQAYWRENSEIWKDRYKNDYYQYEEAAPHLVLQAFLQRVINGGGQVTREMALGTKRLDLCIEYDNQKYPIELKILQNQKGLEDSLDQTFDYMDKTGADKGWLVLFDRDAAKPWDEKIYMREEKVKGKRITVVGC